jgi:hypothetical protein
MVCAQETFCRELLAPAAKGTKLQRPASAVSYYSACVEARRNKALGTGNSLDLGQYDLLA